MTWFTRKSDRSLGETLCTETKDKVGEKNLLSKRASSEVYLVYPCFEPVANYASLKIPLPSLKSLADSTWVFGRPDVNVWQTWQRTFHRGVCSSHRTVELCFGVGVCSFDCCHALDLAASPVPISVMIPIYVWNCKIMIYNHVQGEKSGRNHDSMFTFLQHSILLLGTSLLRFVKFIYEMLQKLGISFLLLNVLTDWSDWCRQLHRRLVEVLV